MATVSQWTPFGVALDLTATTGTVTRKSATQFTVVFNVSWATHWDTETNYGMKAVSGGVTKVLNPFGTYSQKNSGSFTGTFSISGNGAQSKTVTVTFTNWEENWEGTVTESASKSISLTVSVPAWTSYTVSYNANGGSGAPGAQTKWKDQALTLSSTKPSRTGYTFKGWATSASGGVAYAAGGTVAAGTNQNLTLYAVWQAYTYTVSYNANGGSGQPANQTKTYGVTLKLSTTIPTRTNYSFLGWATSASGGVSYAAGANYTTNANITLYAVWSLNYVKPRISGLSVSRCDSSGNANDDGTYVRVKFKWSTDRSVSSITLSWTSANAGSGSHAISASGTSGDSNDYYGGTDCVFSTDSAYTFTVTVADSGGSTPASAVLSSKVYPIDVMPDGNGIAFGKSASKSGYVESAFPISVSKAVGYSIKFRADQTGWYRIGAINGYMTSAVRIIIGGVYNYISPEITEVHAYCAYSRASLQLISTNPQGNANGRISQIRLHGAGENACYVDIYYRYGSSQPNHVCIDVEAMQGEFIPYDAPQTVDVSGLTPWDSLTLNSHRMVDKSKGGLSLESNHAIWLYGGSDSSCVTVASDYLSANTNDAKYLGLSNLKWKAIYAVNGTIQTSDRNQKTAIKPIDDKYIKLFEKLQPVTFKLAGKEHDRIHVGFIAQDVKEAMDELGISPDEFAAYCRDEKIETIDAEEIETDKYGNEYTITTEKQVPVLDEDGNPVYLYSLRYTEFIALNTRMIQENRRKMAEQQNEIDSLKQELAEIKALLKGDQHVTDS